MPKNLAKVSFTDLESSVKRYVKTITQRTSQAMLIQTCWYRLDHSSDFSSRNLRRNQALLIFWKYCTMKIYCLPSRSSQMCAFFSWLFQSVLQQQKGHSLNSMNKNYLRSTVAQDRLDSLEILSIENEETQSLDTNKSIDLFGERKSSAEKFTK